LVPESSRTVPEEEEPLAVPQATMVVVVDARPLGATPPPVAHLGVALLQVVAHQAGEEAVAVGLLAGAEMVDAQLMVVETEVELLTVVTVHEHLMVEALHTEERLHMAEEHLMEEMMARAPHTEASTQGTARLLGAVDPATLQNHQADSLPLHLAHTMRRHLVPMRPPHPVDMVRTRLLPQAAPWMLQRQGTSQHLRLEIPDTSTGQRLQLHQLQGPGNLPRRRRVVKTQDIIEALIL
jgi:hypothetical protein